MLLHVFVHRTGCCDWLHVLLLLYIVYMVPAWLAQAAGCGRQEVWTGARRPLGVDMEHGFMVSIADHATSCCCCNKEQLH